ncbi:hypothetical protein ACFQI7_07440 [Paenibacillus allorhizosphaerae]|uniref:DUF4432 family protein n=1 Tax=Paenibacillus allorhizosphaerae TaxID=2849866 RepID=A0ABM8VG19_9BACL|nr:hypothetical protein [Paenibacillus allorhizosphaerae]CAG7636981.1 hypothetical protein PAECIP111802_02308 [Paenibacillus allorhizosphaerae]
MSEPYGRIRETVHRGLPSVEMESSEVKLIMIPELGGKIVSLQYKPGAKEWLVDSGTRALQPAAYGSEFVAADMSGWDECFPTIVACAYPAEGAFKGTMLPDHGELWSVPWRAHMENGKLVCSAAGRALPYAFKRTMHFLDERTLRFDYKAANLGDETLSVLWAAHPQFLCTEHTRIVLPVGTEKLLCVDGGRTLETGRSYCWPTDRGMLDATFIRVGQASLKDCRKYYVEGLVPKGSIGLYERQSGNYIELEWQPEAVPYVGVWIDEGAFNDQPVCALEPSNGYYDALSDAYRRGTLLRIGAGQTSKWHLDIRLGCEADFVNDIL